MPVQPVPPRAGSQRSWTANTSISMRPSQNPGIEIPTRETSMVRKSAQRPRRTAAATPARTPITVASPTDTRASWTVGHVFSSRMRVTGRFC